MKLSAPKKNVWLVSLILAILGVIGAVVTVPFLSVYAFWLVVIGYILLFLGTVLKGF